MSKTILHFLRHTLGIDRAIGASSATQLMRFVTGPVTMFLIIRHLSPEEQGFFYSFAGVVGIQVFLEAGFAQSITQFTSKEFATLRFHHSGCLTGKPAALSRLRSLFQQANRYYRLMAAVLVLALGFGGYWFFSTKPSHGVPWQIPWIVACIGAGISFLITPVWAFLDGCNRVANVATYRLWTSLGMFAVNAAGMMLGLGIYVVVWGAAFSLAFPVCYLAFRWRRLIIQILRPPGRHLISWRKDIWGFQWRIAGTWCARYLSTTAMPSAVFALSGAAAAGAFGMSFQMIRMFNTIASSWTATKVPAWGAMIADNRWQGFEREWKVFSYRHILISLALNVTFVLFIHLAATRFIDEKYISRFATLPEMTALAFGSISTSVWLVLSHYFRASRKEPYFHLSIAVVILQLLVTFTLAYNDHKHSVAIGYGLSHCIAAFLAYKIWKKEALKEAR